MPDWIAYVRQNLRLPALRPGREAQIAEDLAQQLDDVYQETLASGSSEREAYERACEHIPDWSQFREEISRTEKARTPALDRWAVHVSSRKRRIVPQPAQRPVADLPFARLGMIGQTIAQLRKVERSVFDGDEAGSPARQHACRQRL